ncbi:kinesin heavy chain, putative [Perkinsus marinus ATCC 50983]|uniref:Kinesin-like protein n=1 Tax=Perkinsus marinus (strain ATCC 50983 / TXsc) TaxID=423536 RepID=C5KAV8_PERM5|nr:kinesin heavy chain, putative [Perkinsus marinus ATCC 50983]EER18284.1 kinesin heavy chain, putative [Perkinsus marinus ATCC 50983]|eukprot:XP_002786488.1 kinesin heavy chain, putative [Perkinsus marinus ATCC 50983]
MVSEFLGVSTPRRSVEKCVVEVARLKQRREARRRKSAEKRLERDQEEETLKAAGYACCDVQFERMIREFRATSLRNGCSSTAHHNTDGRIRVVVRKRPLFEYEKKPGQLDIVSMSNPRVLVHECKVKVDGITKFLESHEFAFDRTYSERCGTGELYRTCIEGPTEEVLRDGGRFTVFAYGQTGSGKTYTMVGMEARLVTKIFGEGRDRKSVHVSFYEIYGGRAYDLLNRRNRLRVLEDSSQEVQIPKLLVRRATTIDELSAILYAGNSARTTFATTSNKDSSRSHAVCVISTTSKRGPEARITLVDLAGSERAYDSQSHRLERRIEGAEINKSLLALKECVRACDSGRAHVPFRASKLTMVLRDAFLHEGARMVMIACIKPGQRSGDHTLNTLRYAARLKRSFAVPDLDDAAPLDSALAPRDVESLEKITNASQPNACTGAAMSIGHPDSCSPGHSPVKRCRARLESLPDSEPTASSDGSAPEEALEEASIVAGEATPMTVDEVMEEHLKAIQGDAALLAAETALLAKTKREDGLRGYVDEARQICERKVLFFTIPHALSLCEGVMLKYLRFNVFRAVSYAAGPQ